MNQNKEQIDEYCYVEILDTIGLNRAKDSLKLYKFYENFVKNEVFFCEKNKNFPGEFSNLLKYEYFKNADQAMYVKGLFSLERIMAYLFIFDYSLISSFDEVFTYAYELFHIHSNKYVNKTERSLFYFLGNKYDNPFESENLDKIYALDSNYNYYLGKISQIYESTNESKKFLKYISSKFNFNIKETFIDILGNIGQNEMIYNKLQYDINDRIESKESEEVPKVNNNYFINIFSKCCNRAENRYDEYYNFTESEESNYDNNEIINIQEEANLQSNKIEVDTEEKANENFTDENKELLAKPKKSQQGDNTKCIIM